MTDWSVGKHISWLCSMLVFFSMLLRSTIKLLGLLRFNRSNISGFYYGVLKIMHKLLILGSQ